MKIFGLALVLALAGCVSRSAPSPEAPSPEAASEAMVPGSLELRSDAGLVLSWSPAAHGRGQLVLRRVVTDQVEEWRSELPTSSFEAFLKGGRLSLGKAGELASDAALAPQNGEGGARVMALPVRATGGLEAIVGKATFRTELRLLNLNVLNYWDANPKNSPEDRLFGYDEFRPGFSNWFEPRIQEAKAATVARALVLAGLPEVVALQELEWAQGASEVFAPGTVLRRELEKLGYRSFLVGKQGPENVVAITTGFVSRYPLRDAAPIAFNIHDEEFRDFSERERYSVRFSTRNIQVAELEVMGRTLRLYNNHWRSKGCSDEAGCDRSERVRQANARVLARGLKDAREKFPNVDHVILGDFNSEYDDASLLETGSTGDLAAVQSGAAGRLYNPWYELPASARWERSYAGKKITLSQILVDGSLFDADGFQYRPGSFEVVGQSGTAARVFLNADGEPLRWQTAKLKVAEAPEASRQAIEAGLRDRGCSADTLQKRKCKVSYAAHMGVGFFDHLPVALTLQFTGTTDKARTRFVAENQPAQASVEDLGPCAAEKAVTYPELSTLDLADPALLRRCVRFEPKEPQTLLTRGIYDANYVVVQGVAVGFSMFNAYDPRAVVDGRIQPQQGDRMHDLSDMCFVRKVLQKEGGKVAKAFGRLGFDNGIVTLYFARRSDVQLVELPPEKEVVCGGKH